MICQVCGVEAPTRSIFLFQHVGLILIGLTGRINGQLCRRCINRYALRFSLITLFFGWWGWHSLFLTPIFLIINLIQFIRSRSLAPAPPNAQAPTLDEVTLKRLDRYRDEVVGQLASGQERASLAHNLAFQTGATPGQIYLYSLLVAPPAAKRRWTIAGWLRRAA